MNENLFHLFLIVYSILIYIFRIRISTKLGIIDIPDNNRKVHKIPISAAGGLILFPYITLSLIFLTFLSLIKIKILLIWIFLYVTFFFTGFIDDKIQLNAKSKTFILLFVLFVTLPLDKGLIISSLEFKNLDYVVLLNQGSLFFTIFCIYLFYNSLNFADGLNGISISLSIFFIVLLLNITNQINIFHYSILISLLILFIPNIFGKIFLGNSGISFISCVFSLLFIDAYNNKDILFDEIMLIVFLPCVDAARVTVERIISGESPFKSDKNHFHHLLMKICHKKYVFIPYSIFAVMPYLITTLDVHTYYSLLIFSLIYLISLNFLKKNNV